LGAGLCLTGSLLSRVQFGLEAEVTLFGCFGSDQQSVNRLLRGRYSNIQSIELL
jgi:hypothetical protein